MADQGDRSSAVAVRRRRPEDQRTSLRQPQGCRTATGDTKAALKLEYPNYSGALATAGGLVFIGHVDGTLTAHDAKTLKEVWSFSVAPVSMRRRSRIRPTASNTLPFSPVRGSRRLSFRTLPN